jgi:hypothetical protein
LMSLTKDKHASSKQLFNSVIVYLYTTFTCA